MLCPVVLTWSAMADVWSFDVSYASQHTFSNVTITILTNLESNSESIKSYS